MPSEAALTCRYCSGKTEPNCPSLIGQWFNLLTDYASLEKITANLKDNHNHFSQISPSLSHHNYPLVKVGRGGKRTTLTLRLWKSQISPGPMRPTDVSQGLRLGQLLTGKCLSCLQKYFSTFLLSSIISLPSSPPFIYLLSLSNRISSSSSSSSRSSSSTITAPLALFFLHLTLIYHSHYIHTWYSIAHYPVSIQTDLTLYPSNLYSMSALRCTAFLPYTKESFVRYRESILTLMKTN